MIEVRKQAGQESHRIPGGIERVNVLLRLIVAVLVFSGAVNGRAQVESIPEFSLCITVFDRLNRLPLQGVLITVMDDTGHTDSLFTDTAGVARTFRRADTLNLPGGRDFSIHATRPNFLNIIDQLATDTLYDSTVFVKEYYLGINDVKDGDGWRIPNVYFHSNATLLRTDSAWYQQAEGVNSTAEAVAIVVQMMKDNPTMILKTMGYCDVREKDCRKLALARATYVKNMLETEGIPAARLQAEGVVDAHRCSNTEYAKMNKQDRKSCLARDRRVDYVVVGYIGEP
jgi:hypothetical protein